MKERDLTVGKLVGYKSPGRRVSRTQPRRISPWALCRVCGQEVADWRFRSHPVCLNRVARERARAA